MLQARDLIEHQIWWHSIMGSPHMWYDNWIVLDSLHFITPEEIYCDDDTQTVGELVVEGRWDEQRMNTLFPHDLA